MALNLTIRATLLSLVSVLALGAIALSSKQALEAARNRADALQAVEANITSDHLLDAAASWARERGVTAVALAAAAPAAAAVRADIAKAREAADREFRAGIDRIKQGPDFAGKGQVIADAEAAQRKLAEYRAVVDAEMAKPGAERTATTVAGWVPAATAAVEQVKAVRLAADFTAETTEAAMAAYSHIKHNLWIISEFAGRQRALLGKHIAEKRPLDADALRQIGSFRGRVEQSYEMVDTLAKSPVIAPVMREETAKMQRAFFGEFGPIRSAVIEAGSKGADYPLSAADWVAAATKGIDAVVSLSDAASRGARGLSASTAAQGTQSLVLNLAALLAIIALAGVAFFVTVARVTRPIAAMTAVMGRLASKDWAAEVPAKDRRDEIGQMAQAVQVFKDNGIENERLQKEAEEARIRQQRDEEEQRRLKEEAAKAEERRSREAEEAKRRAEEERRAEQERMKAEAEKQRRAEMRALADGFEATVKGVVETVSSSASEMQSSSTSMSATA
ncbi:MAG: HAMP domain-containing protein, partial [Alphaproteobacteria bacterium]|nr:HAMP domain-containing protein [Alphaproteobacteria bacterium]